jgi:hypothetical protein
MPLITRLADDGVEQAGDTPAQAQQWLCRLGVQAGRLLAPRAPAGVSPRLAHAAELLVLERRFGSSQFVRARPGDALRESTLHTHDAPERLVVLTGEVVLALRAPALGGWLRVRLHERDWLALPAGLPHRRLDNGQGVELLRLVHDTGGLRLRGATPAPADAPRPLRQPTLMPQRQDYMRSPSLATPQRLPTVAA